MTVVTGVDVGATLPEMGVGGLGWGERRDRGHQRVDGRGERGGCVQLVPIDVERQRDDPVDTGPPVSCWRVLTTPATMVR